MLDFDRSIGRLESANLFDKLVIALRQRNVFKAGLKDRDQVTDQHLAIFEAIQLERGFILLTLIRPSNALLAANFLNGKLNLAT